jgi:hypothetical protein
MEKKIVNAVSNWEDAEREGYAVVNHIGSTLYVAVRNFENPKGTVTAEELNLIAKLKLEGVI